MTPLEKSCQQRVQQQVLLLLSQSDRYVSFRSPYTAFQLVMPREFKVTSKDFRLRYLKKNTHEE